MTLHSLVCLLHTLQSTRNKKEDDEANKYKKQIPGSNHSKKEHLRVYRDTTRGKGEKKRKGTERTKRGGGGEIIRKADTGAYRHAKLPGWHHASYLGPKEGSAS